MVDPGKTTVHLIVSKGPQPVTPTPTCVPYADQHSYRTVTRRMVTHPTSAAVPPHCDRFRRVCAEYGRV